MKFSSHACHAVGKYTRPATAHGGAGHLEELRVEPTTRMIDRPSWQYISWMAASDPDGYRRRMLREHG
ncbi:unnamed protein product [marine sediment metagenome]|uniref:Uncharacterized protein n=1 Tax=marine sediment metagenome TaxID=412755 RepID=X0YIA9_9ZZZZ